MKTFKSQLAATVLLEALYTTDEKACAKYGITQRTLQNYRRRLHVDPDLSHIFAIKKREFDKAWADKFPVAIRAALKFVTEAATDPPSHARGNPEYVRAIVGALKICAEVLLTNKVLDARLAQYRGAGPMLRGANSDDSEDGGYTH